MTLPEQELCPTRPLLLYRADVVFLALAPATFSFSMVRTPDSYDCLLKGCSQGAGLVLHTSENGPVRVGLVGGGRSRMRTLLRPAHSLLTGKNTGNFAPSAGSNCALLLVNARPEPISSDHPCIRRKSEQGINRDGIRELTGAHQGKNRELFLDAFRAADPTPSRPDLVIRHPHGRERCSGRCQLQKSTTRKFHGFLLWSRL